jgi:sec-independent protein translocase protein TatC
MGNAVGYTNPTDPFNMYLKVSLIMGIFVASPFVLYQIWAFIAPGLYKSERRYVAPFMFSTVGLFVAGGLFAYKMVYPAALDFLIDYSKQFTPQHQ